MGVQRDVGGNPSIPPSSFWSQRSAQPVGINKKVLSECIGIVIVAFGSAPILAFLFALRAWVTLGISSPNPRQGTSPLDPMFASRGFKFHN